MVSPFDRCVVWMNAVLVDYMKDWGVLSKKEIARAKVLTFDVAAMLDKKFRPKLIASIRDLCSGTKERILRSWDMHLERGTIEHIFEHTNIDPEKRLEDARYMTKIANYCLYRLPQFVEKKE